MKFGKNMIKDIFKEGNSSEISRPKAPLVEIVGKRRILIENHCGITSYGSNRITVQVKSGCIIIVGSMLMIAQMSSERLIVVGCIDDVQLVGRG